MEGTCAVLLTELHLPCMPAKKCIAGEGKKLKRESGFGVMKRNCRWGRFDGKGGFLPPPSSSFPSFLPPSLVRSLFITNRSLCGWGAAGTRGVQLPGAGFSDRALPPSDGTRPW